MNKRRLIEFDILRSFAIFCILLDHIKDYAGSARLQAADQYLVLGGISLFVFISGYLVSLNNKINDNKSLVVFAKKRLLRIYLLYFPALLMLAVMYYRRDMIARIPDLIIHIGCAQVLLAPRVVQLPTIWFVGLMMLYYILYGLLARTTRGVLELLGGAILMFFVLMVAAAKFNILESRFFLYYPVFITGVILQRAGVFEKKAVKETAALMAALLVLWVTVIWLTGKFGRTGQIVIHAGSSVGAGLIEQAEIFCIVFVGLFFACSVAAISPNWLSVLIRYISVSSFAVFLYHRPFFFVITKLMDRFVSYGPTTAIAVYVLVAIPLVFALSFLVQLIERRVVQYFGLQRSSAVP